MRRMLIVDDEPLILDGLYAYFQKAEINELEIIKVYSAVEAVEWLNTVRIDIVLSDICMPGMDGMALIQEIMDRWPRCKIILLTGHNEFDYAHQAIRNPCVVDYLLKTEGMSQIRKAVERALQQISEENDFRHQTGWFRNKLPRALPQLHRQLLMDTIQRDENLDPISLQDEFDAIQLPFTSSDLVLPVVIRVEEWNNYDTSSDRSLIRYAAANIAEEYLQDKARVKAVDLDHQVIACFVQSENSAYHHTVEDGWIRTIRFVHGTLETVQQSVASCLNISASIMVSEQPVEWSKLNQVITRLRLSGLEGPGQGMEKLLRVDVQNGSSHTPLFMNKVAVAALHLEQIKQRLTTRDKDWSESFRKWTETASEGLEDPFFRMRIYSAASSCLLEVLQELGLYESALKDIDLSKILHYNVQTRWTEIVSFFQSAFEWIASKRSDSRITDQSQILIAIHTYIKNHLEDDLSLTRIAQEVSLNPSYLSRWYKRITGKGISDYIYDKRVERSKELLLGSTLKMHEISSKVGFSDQHYFYRFFKKAIGCTPQEYRDQKN
ncbi:response regulator [Neobacillus mesonae]|nr:response regulator [Neobacillus mesonae]